MLPIKQTLFLKMIIFYAIFFENILFIFLRNAVATKYNLKLKILILFKLSIIVDSLIVISRFISLEELINLNRSNKHQNHEKAKSHGILNHKLRRKVSINPKIDTENVDRSQDQIDKEASQSSLCLFEISSLNSLNLENHQDKTKNDKSKVKDKEKKIVSIATSTIGLDEANST